MQVRGRVLCAYIAIASDAPIGTSAHQRHLLPGWLSASTGIVNIGAVSEGSADGSERFACRPPHALVRTGRLRLRDHEIKCPLPPGPERSGDPRGASRGAPDLLDHRWLLHHGEELHPPAVAPAGEEVDPLPVRSGLHRMHALLSAEQRRWPRAPCVRNILGSPLMSCPSAGLAPPRQLERSDVEHTVHIHRVEIDLLSEFRTV